MRQRTYIRSLIAGLLALAAMMIPACALAEDETALARMMEELDKTDQQRVEEALKSQLNDEDRAFVEEIVRRGKNIPEVARQISEGDYTGIGNALASGAAEQLAKEIEERYKEGSPMRTLLDSVKDNEELYAKLTKAALNADPDEAAVALQDALKEHAKSKIDELRGEGEKFWKDLFNSLLPGSEVAKRVGIDPASIYAQAVSDVADLSRRANRELDTFVFDCMHRRFKKLVREGDTEQTALTAIGDSLGPNDRGFDCVADRKRDEPKLDTSGEDARDSILLGPGRIYRQSRDAAQRQARGGSTMAKWEVDPEDIAKLIAIYEEGVRSGQITNTGFADWVQKRLSDELRKRGRKLTSALEEQQKKIAEIVAERLRRLVASLMPKLSQAMKQTLGEERYRQLGELPAKDTLPKPEEQKKDDKTKTASKDDELYDQMMKELKERECDPRNAPPKRTPGTVDKDGFIAVTEDHGGPYELPPGCEPYGKPQRFEYEGVEKGKADKQPRCARLGKAIVAAGSQYAKGEVEAAKASLEGILAQLDGLSGEERCPDVRTRVAGNLGKIKRLVDVLATLNKGLTKCEPEALRHEHEQLSGATHVKLVASRAQLLRAVPVAERYTQARLAYKEGRIEDAASLFQTALTKAEEAQAPTCVDIEKRTRSNLARIDQMKELERSISGVIDQCDMAAMERRKAKLLGSTNPFLIKLHTRLSNPPARCQQLVSNRQCADQFGGGWTAGPADEKGQIFCRPPSEAAANHWCEEHNEGSGWVAGEVQANGWFGCYPSYGRQKSAAFADCRQQHGSRLIKVYKYKGQWYCSYRTKSVKQRRRHQPRARTSHGGGGYDPRAAAAAAAVAGAVIQGIIQSQGGGHHHGGGCAANPRAPGC